MGDDTFTVIQLRSTLEHVRAVLRSTVIPGIKRTLLSTGEEAAEHASESTVKYLQRADSAFRGVGTQPLALDTAAVLDRAQTGVQASILSRIASSGEPIVGADQEPHPAKLGVLQRYGVETIGHFERSLQQGMIQKKSKAEMRDDLIAASPFLQQAPAHWAVRIVRTETMGALNRAHWESIREADDQLGDMTKILVATFDSRTGADSYAVHGQIRLPDQAFESWFGLYQHPPNRPNDRETVVPHRIAWPIPAAFAWRTTEEIAARWKYDGRKGSPPARPLMTTIPLSRFGR